MNLSREAPNVTAVSPTMPSVSASTEVPASVELVLPKNGDYASCIIGRQNPDIDALTQFNLVRKFD
jgi:hypothetical protein